ncbi:SDR family oxidoreductase [Ideonella sp. A 288]|uniref:SDR family oxidoreductase n=1 Tax=Ideonella sp. A 288 TaxID=1962181 RepID=UPI000B4BC6B6|nr:SDR family oxidoreductase [Ideonella sp. A 288]
MSRPTAALVTGTSTGIGRVICEHLLAAGHEVVAMSRRSTDLQHPRLHSMAVDLGDRAATAAAAREAAGRFDLTTVVHNAGIIRPALLADARLDDLDALTELHLGSAITLVQAALPAMRARRFGRIVLMSSRGALGLATRTVYAATKAGMIGMARTWALELAPEGITVNVVAPGPIRGTEMFHAVVPAESERERKLAEAIPVKRLGTPEDVARAVDFFVDPGNGFVTGQVLYVCGGASVGTIVV